MNKEVVIISELSESSGGTFAATAHVEARFSCYFHILFTSRTLQISHVKASFLRKNLCWWKIMSGRKSLVKKIKKIKKKRLKEERKSTNLSRKEKNFLCESDWCWRSSTLAFRVWIKKSPSNQNLPYTMLKTRFPFLYASTSLDAKTFVYKTLASDRNFESCMSIRCLAPQHILQFFHFCCGCFLCIGNFAHHCVVLLNAPLSDRDKKNVSAMGFFSREILVHSQWR